MAKKFTFEDKADVVDRIIEQRRYKWQLKAVAWMDYDDVAQLLRLHFHKKWNKWDQKRPLEPWLNRIITRQLSNLSRNLYGNYAKPCIGCPFNGGDTNCTLYGEQGVKCPLYAKWETGTRKQAYNIKLPVSTEFHQSELNSTPDDSLDLEKAAKILHEKMKKILKPFEWRVYNLLYVKQLTEEQVAKKMGYTTSESNRFAGYKRIGDLKKVIIEKVKEVLREDGCSTFDWDSGR